MSPVLSTQPIPPGERASGKASWRRWHLSLEKDGEQELSDGGCVVERAFQAEGTAQITAWKEDPPVPNNGADTRIRNGGKE